MFRKGLLLSAVAALLSLPTVTQAAVERPFEITLGGGASNGNEFDGFSASANGSIGYYFTDSLEVLVRQSISYTDVAGIDGSILNGSTRLALDFHIPLGDKQQFVPFIGANIGYVYGEGVVDTWAAAPEAGIKIYVNSSTFVFVLAEYQFFFEDSDDADDAFDDGQFVYTLGIGFRF